VVNALTKAVSDPDYRVRRNAALAITDVGPDAEGAIPNLLEMLDDENRYNRFYAATALKGIGTQKANSALLDNLFTARWCPITTPESTF
jgi:HEAT repeat protein